MVGFVNKTPSWSLAVIPLTYQDGEELSEELSEDSKALLRFKDEHPRR
jgi:hypothetical protein